VPSKLRSLSKTYQSLCKSSNDFRLNSDAVHAHPKKEKKKNQKKSTNWIQFKLNFTVKIITKIK